MTDVKRILLASDHDPGWLRRAVATGELVRLRRGAYVSASTVDDQRAPEAQRAAAIDRVRAVHAALRTPHVIGGPSAALLWGLRLWEVPSAVHVLQATRGAGDSAADIVRHRGLPTSYAEIDGLPVATLERTVLDCLLWLPPLAGLVVTDSAFALGLDEGTIRAALAARTKRNGRARATLLLDLADAGAESAWESWLRYLALRSGLPQPVTQYPVTTPLGTFRVDLAWPKHHVLAEFDGLVKYTDEAFGAGYDGRRALVEEKRREDAIAEVLGVRPVRFMAVDARRPDAVIARLTARFPRDLRGTLRTDRRLPLPD